MLVYVKMSYVRFLWIVFLCGSIVSTARSQRSDLSRTNELENHSSGRHFVSTSNPAVAISQLVLESHHEVTPSAQPLRHTVPPIAVSSSAGSLERLATAVHANPVLAALLISTLLGTNNGIRPIAYNSPAHEPPNPYVALLLSSYGRYIPRPGATSGHGLYSYNAANNIHNTRPFGAYKIYEDSS